MTEFCPVCDFELTADHVCVQPAVTDVMADVREVYGLVYSLLTDETRGPLEERAATAANEIQHANQRLTQRAVFAALGDGGEQS